MTDRPGGSRVGARRRRTPAMRWRCDRASASSCGRALLHAIRVHGQDRRPAVGCVDRRAHRLATIAVALEVPMLEVDACRVAKRNESHLDLARARDLGLIAPLMR